MLRSEGKIDLLRRTPLFGSCSRRELIQVARASDEVDFVAGRALIKEGSVGREFFVLIDGTVKVTKNGKKVAELKGGDWLGEIALLTDKPRTATVTATSAVDVLVITDRRFRNVVETMPSIAIKVLGRVSDRLTHDEHS